MADVYPESLQYSIESDDSEFADEESHCDIVESLIENNQSIEFHIGSQDDSKATQLKCKRCGSDRFNVAQDIGNYYTAIKCPNCEYEIMIHGG